ncbi:MAG: CopG family transcriptional regulator [Thaumarchaeota archaeon]|nr:CopG family transcriptional regulator [Nitrososphaerota archaeon]
MASSSQKKYVVGLDEDLYQSIKEIIKGKGFAAVDDYVNYVLRISIGKQKEAFDQEDTEAITARLKALGYI